MVLAGVFSGLGGLMMYCLYLCWLRYWYWVYRRQEVVALLHRPGLQSFEELQPFYVRQEICCDREDAWHKRYHWCLLLMPIFLGLAAFCAVYVLTEDLHPWIHVPLTAVGAAGTLLGCGYLGYGIVREKILPFEDGKFEEE